MPTRRVYKLGKELGLGGRYAKKLAEPSKEKVCTPQVMLSKTGRMCKPRWGNATPGSLQLKAGAGHMQT